MSLAHQIQIFLGADHHARLVDVAQERGVSLPTVIRDAIDPALPASGAHRPAAAGRLLAAEPVSVPEPDALAAELAALRARAR